MWQQLNVFRPVDIIKMTCSSSKWASAWLLVPNRLMIYWDFPTQASLGLTENSPEKRKQPKSSSSLDENASLMPKVRAEWPDLQLVTLITTHYGKDVQKSIPEHIAHPTLTQMSYSSRGPYWAPLLSGKNRKLTRQSWWVSVNCQQLT